MSRTARFALAGATTALALGLSSCASASSGGTGAAPGGLAIPVKAGDTSCEIGSTQFAAGTVTFNVQNTGSQMNEFYVYDKEGKNIVAEVENVGPGLTRDLTAQLASGSYISACKPGGTGDGIRGTLTVTGGSAGPTGNAAALEQAVTQYTAFVATEAAGLLTGTTTFVAAIKAGDVAAAKAAYPGARVHWERIEPVAESFGDLDPRMDARENDVEPGTKWTGWHRLEKELWVTGLSKDAPGLADQLLKDTQELVAKVATVKLTPAQLGNGAKELLDEVATSKVTGEEERYSHVDLWDFAANIDGAKEAFEALKPVAQAKDPALVTLLTTRFAALDAELAGFQHGDGYVLYTTLTKAQVKTLADLVDALSEPLSKLTVTVVG